MSDVSRILEMMNRQSELYSDLLAQKELVINNMRDEIKHLKDSNHAPDKSVGQSAPSLPEVPQVPCAVVPPVTQTCAAVPIKHDPSDLLNRFVDIMAWTREHRAFFDSGKFFFLVLLNADDDQMYLVFHAQVTSWFLRTHFPITFDNLENCDIFAIVRAVCDRVPPGSSLFEPARKLFPLLRNTSKTKYSNNLAAIKLGKMSELIAQTPRKLVCVKNTSIKSSREIKYKKTESGKGGHLVWGSPIERSEELATELAMMAAGSAAFFKDAGEVASGTAAVAAVAAAAEPAGERERIEPVAKRLCHGGRLKDILNP